MKKSEVRRLAGLLPRGLSEADFRRVEAAYFGDEATKVGKAKIQGLGGTIGGAVSSNKKTEEEEYNKKATAKVADDDKGWKRRPTIEGAISAANKQAGLPPKDRTTLALLGLFHLRHKGWRGFDYDAETLGEQYATMDLLAERDGDVHVAEAIEVLFRKQAPKPLDWVEQRTLRWLASERNWNKYIVPGVAHFRKLSRGGEQSEWSDTTPTAEGGMTVKRSKL